MCRGTPGPPRLTEADLCGMPNIPIQQVEDSLDRPRTPPSFLEKGRSVIRELSCPLDPTLVRLGTAQVAVERGPLGHTALHSQDSGVPLFEASLPTSLTAARGNRR